MKIGSRSAIIWIVLAFSVCTWFWLRNKPSVVVAQTTGERIGSAWEDTRNPIFKLFKGKRLDLYE